MATRNGHWRLTGWAAAVAGMVAGAAMTRAELPESVTHNGRQYRVVRPARVRTLDRSTLHAAPGSGQMASLPVVGDGSFLPVKTEATVTGLRDAAATHVFYRQSWYQYCTTHSWTWGNVYNLEVPSGAGAAVVTEIQTAALFNASASETVEDVCVLVEIYDSFNAAGNPLHADYLGGALLYYGTLGPEQDTGPLVYRAVDAGLPYYFQVSSDGDNQVFISFWTGRLVDGAGGAGGTFVPTIADGGIVMSFGLGAERAPTIGTTPETFYADEGPLDRIYNAATDGPIWYNQQPSYLSFELAGEMVADCYLDDDYVIDSAQVECGNALGYPGCESGSCVHFQTGGQFQDPLGVGWVVPALCDVYPPNGWPDVCEDYDCNQNGVPDAQDAGTTSPDCNYNARPDECEIDENSTAPGGPYFCIFLCSPDCNNDGIPDDCQLEDNDCDGNEVPDDCQIADGSATDCDANGVLDFCEHVHTDCNRNGVIDFCDILSGHASDTDGNGVPDACDALNFCWDLWDDFSEEEGYQLGAVEGQPASEPDSVMRWSTAESTAVFDIVAWADACNDEGYALKIEGTSNPDRLTSPLFGPPAQIDGDFHRQVLTFSYMVSNGLTDDATQLMIHDDNGQPVTGMEFGIYDFAEAGQPPDPRPTVMVLDGEGVHIVAPIPENPEAFTWTPGECEEMSVWLIRQNGIERPRVGFRFGDDPTVWLFGATEGGEHMARFDDSLNWTPWWADGTPGQVHDFHLDNVQLCVIGPDIPITDCNGNGVDDSADINLSGLSADVIVNATGAPGADGIPDECCVVTCDPGDFNCDLSADLLDYAFLQRCVGPVAGGGPLCGCADINGDGAVDGADVGLFSAYLSGPR